MKYDICVIGGAGHVGLPLSLVFAQKGQRVLIHDLNTEKLECIKTGTMPFMEQGAEPLLKEVLAQGMLGFSDKLESVAHAQHLIITIGTPVDEFMNPTLRLISDCISRLTPYLNDDQVIILRSTVYPGVTDWLSKHLERKNLKCRVAFCPERVVQGRAIEELKMFPQLVSGATPEAEEAAARLFGLIASEIVRTTPKEAEFAKLFCNAYRYIQFAVSNQFYMMCELGGVDYYNILAAMKYNYPRMDDVPRAGFAAGPCLFKDSMQLAAFSENQFTIGYNAMLVNEGLPLFLVGRLMQKHDLSKMTVGLLGMAFKSESDDRRSSLSYKLKKVLTPQAKDVLTTDPFVTDDPELRPLQEVMARSDVLFLCAPHRVYKDLNLRGKVLIDIWNFWPREKVD